MPVLPIGLAILAATAAPVAAAPDAAEQQRSFVAAQQLVRAGRPADALPMLRALRARIEAGLAGETRTIYSGQTPAMILADMMAARAAKTGAIDAGPVYAQAVFLEGFALVDLGRPGEARAALDRAAALSPGNPQFACEDAHAHARDHDAAGALPIYERCAANSAMLGKEHEARWRAAALRGQGFALTELRRLDEAEAAYRGSLEIEPGNAVALRELRYVADLRGGAATRPASSTMSDR